MFYNFVLVCQATVMKQNKLGGLNSWNLLFPSPGGQKSKIKVLAGSIPSEGKKGRICFRPLPLAYWWMSSCSHGILPDDWLYPNFLFLQGHQSYWMKVHPNECIITWLSLSRLYLQISSHYKVLRLDFNIWVFGDTIQALTTLFK